MIPLKNQYSITQNTSFPESQTYNSLPPTPENKSILKSVAQEITQVQNSLPPSPEYSKYPSEKITY